ncbi:MAG: Mfa1 fimbrilin C-terminal domain-containing protein [Alistipes sp.]|nr:Mfa1 fimbrilin C-terminal domain-containing protein [Alistipes sp.]
MKKYLFFALALLGMASCAKDDLGNGNKPNHNGEVEESYIAINLMAADSGTRATDGGYEEGTTAERAVKTAYFFFFDENGEPFNVVNAPATAPGGAKNHLALDITPMANGTDVNVSDISNAVLILNTYEGIYPKQIVAVLNWVPQKNTYSLKELHNNLTALVGVEAAAGGFVMSNSVYMNDGKVIDAVALTEDNIKKTASEATNSPIDIYVERIAAKVVLTAGGVKAESNTHTNVFNTQKAPDMFVGSGELENTPVFVQLLGWELYNDYNNSYLLKNIDTTWGDGTTLGLVWNDPFKFRSYWAISQNTALEDEFTWQYTSEKQNEKGFKTEYGFAVASDATYTVNTTYTYCGENTNQVVLNGEGKVTSDLRTKVILKGQLLQSDGNGGHKELELASWYGNEYAGTQNLLTAVANSLAYTLYHSDDQTTFHPITAADIVCDINIAGTKSYETGFKLSVAGEGKTWYKYSSDGNHQPFNLTDSADNIAKTNAYLAANVKPAIIYVDGMTYYYVDVEHLGANGSDTQYGVVRNHVYQIDINSIKGYGSPIYSGEDFTVDNPEYPEEVEDTYVAARINVLSWKVVKQTVDIVQ